MSYTALALPALVVLVLALCIRVMLLVFGPVDRDGGEHG